MATKVGICNLALSHAGSGKEIQDFDNDNTDEAAACRRFYDQALEELLRDFPWPFAKRQVALALISEDPNSEWAFEYQYPTDAKDLIRILSGNRNDNRQTRTPYQIYSGTAGLVIYTNMVDACMEYTLNETDPSTYPPDFAHAVALLLAVFIMPRVTSGDPFQLTQRAQQLFFRIYDKARANAANEQQDEEVPDADFIRTREGDIVSPSRRQSFLDLFGA